MCKEPGYNCYKLPFGSSNFSFKLSLHDSFSMGVIKFSSVDKENERERKRWKDRILEKVYEESG